jgi:hypothetical protein
MLPEARFIPKHHVAINDDLIQGLFDFLDQLEKTWKLTSVKLSGTIDSGLRQ